MSRARERQYTRAQAAIRICEYIRQHRTITIRDAVRVTGRSYRSVYHLLIELDEILGMYITRDCGEGGAMRRRLIEDDEE